MLQHFIPLHILTYFYILSMFLFKRKIYSLKEKIASVNTELCWNYLKTNTCADSVPPRPPAAVWSLIFYHHLPFTFPVSEWYHSVRKQRHKSKDSALEITPEVMSLNLRWWLETRISWSIYSKVGFLWFAVVVGWRELYYSFWTWCMGKVGFLETSCKGCFQYLCIYVAKDWARWVVYSFSGSGKTWSETIVQLQTSH